MQFSTAIYSTFALLMATQTFGAAVPNPNKEVARDDVSILIATDPYYACNCPNNCSHKSGSSCKYYAGPSDSSDVIEGTCTDRGGSLSCVA